MNSDQVFLIALGGNLPSKAGKPAQTLRLALKHLQNAGGKNLSVSRFYSTPCFPAGAGPDYVNAAAKISFAGDAHDLLTILHRIEDDFGRERTQRWGRRTLDLDLIAAGDQVLPDRAGFQHWQALPPAEQTQITPDRLIIPHPRLQDRGFVLVPLADVAPDWCHPVLKKTVSQMLGEIPGNQLLDIVAL
jgi:2-amino-4-hydroxy-6-hydroxymethyldihydropteridine diphosphokinase